MFDYDGMRKTVAAGLKKYLNCPVIRGNQNEEPPAYPYVSYNVITPFHENKGTYGEYDDGVHRKPFTQTWSITAQSDDNSESVNLAIKAHEWLDHVGTQYLKENGVDVQSVGNVTNRDNVLTVEYEYKNGFDVVFYLFNEVGDPNAEIGYVEGVELNNNPALTPKTTEELTQMLNDRLSGR